jgi:multidrug efflux pump subunit AcrA (membrane-fusion protein)
MSCVLLQGARMRHQCWPLPQVIAAIAAIAIGCSSGFAQFGGGTPSGTPAAKPVEGKPAIIERAPLILRDSARFQIPLKLEAAKTVHVSARVDGVVATLLTKLGERVQAQAEVARLESQERQLELSKAQAALRAAQAERTAASGNSVPAAEARVEEAKGGVELAALRLDYCNLRTPLSGIVTQVHVTEGQFVRAGDPIVTVVDPLKLRIDVPVDGKTVTPGATVQIQVEDQTVSGTVEAVVPLNNRFEPLRDLFVSVASGILTIDNSTGKWKVGQTAYSPMIPRQGVTEVPTSAISNAGDGERKVQVIRDGIVRDIRIQPLGQQGEQYVFVSGRFGATDEVVLKSSEPLLDGARVVASDPAAAAAGAGGASGTASAPKAEPPRRSGF